MKTVIEMAREACDKDKVDAWHNGFWTLTQEELARFAELVRADERNRTWTQEHWTEYERSIVEAEREAIAKWLENEKDAPYWAELVRARSNT